MNNVKFIPLESHLISLIQNTHQYSTPFDILVKSKNGSLELMKATSIWHGSNVNHIMLEDGYNINLLDAVYIEDRLSQAGCIIVKYDIFPYYTVNRFMTQDETWYYTDSGRYSKDSKNIISVHPLRDYEILKKEHNERTEKQRRNVYALEIAMLSEGNFVHSEKVKSLKSVVQ